MSTRDFKSDAQTLINGLLPLAKRLLEEFHELHPYAGAMLNDGGIISLSTEEGDLPSEALSSLEAALKKLAWERKLLAVATVSNTSLREIAPSGARDAIRVSIQHCCGYAADVYFTYQFDGEESLRVDPPHASKGTLNVLAISAERAKGVEP